MKTINLREFYKALYDYDTICEVPDEVAELLELYRKKERAYWEYLRYHKAFYSLDYPNAENEVLFHVLSAEEEFEQKLLQRELYAAMDTLGGKQLTRLYAYFFLGMSYSQIAKIEGVDEKCVRRSIDTAVRKLRKIIYFNFLKF